LLFLSSRVSGAPATATDTIAAAANPMIKCFLVIEKSPIHRLSFLPNRSFKIVVIVPCNIADAIKKDLIAREQPPASDSRLILAPKVKANGLFDHKNGNRVEQMGISQ
jgi:hypothetical protein